MPVNSHHIEYAYRKSDWAKLRTFIEGARKVRAAGETYLPKSTGWTDDEYNAYKNRAEVYGAVDRTIDGLDGAIFRKPPAVKTPTGEAEIITKDITLTGQTLTEWIRNVVREILSVGRFGVLVEFSGGPDQAGRPYAVNFSAESIINWETEIVNGETRLSMIVLEENILVNDARDPFVKIAKLQYRVLRLVEGVYNVELWEEEVLGPNLTQAKAMEKVYKQTKKVIPLRRGASLNKIPFFFISPSGQHIAPEKPPLLDITELCVLHYMTSADYAHGLHWVGLPTPWATGVRDKDALQIGPSTAIVLEDPEAKVGMLEFSGTGLNAVKERLEGLERKMAALGARILEEQKRDAESGEAIKLRQGGDASALAGISDAVSRAAESILSFMLWWQGTGDKLPEVTVALNMDFFSQAMDPQMIVALMQAQQSALISKDTFIWNMKRGEMLPEDVSIEDEKEKAANDAPPMPTPAAGGGGGGGQ